MAAIFIPSYWPFFRTAEKRVFTYYLEGDEALQFSSVFSYDAKTDSMLYKDFDKAGKWTDTWFYRYQPGFGLAEWRDDYPDGKRIVYTTPIGWGEYTIAPGIYDNFPRKSLFESWPPTLPLAGKQNIVFEALLDTFALRDGTTFQNVLQFVYQQTWNGKTGGARYWMAQGVGPIALSWVAPDADGHLVTVGRYDARLRPPLVA